MVDAEISMVFGHVCRRNGADPGICTLQTLIWKRRGAYPDILESLVEDIEVLSHRQVVFKSGKENPVKAAQRELAA